MLLTYFGEKTDHDCGQCDVCLERKKSPKAYANDVETAIRIIIDFLQDGQYHPLTALKTLPIRTDVLDDAVHHMTDEELIEVSALSVRLSPSSN